MAWRIDEAVIRGEIDNRIRDRITGRLWLSGFAEPIELDLAGNAWRDLAGRRLEFVNLEPKPQAIEGFGRRQTGVIGDCTASRKVRVPEIPLDQIGEYYAARKPFPWHWGNSLYLEWFSPTNGRVVIESASFQLAVGDEIAWEMTAAEEEAQQRVNAEAMGGFFQQLGAAIVADRARKGEPLDDTPPEWNEEPEGVEAAVDDEAAANAAEELTSDVPADHPHPLVRDVFELQLRFRREAEQRDWMPAGATDEHPVADLVLSVRDAARKLAGALETHDWPPARAFCEVVIAQLQGARGHLGHALLAAAYCDQEKLVDPDWLARVQREINAVVHACDKLTGEARAQLGPAEE